MAGSREVTDEELHALADFPLSVAGFPAGQRRAMQGRRRDSAAIPDALANAGRAGTRLGLGRRTGRLACGVRPMARSPLCLGPKPPGSSSASPTRPTGARSRCMPRARGNRLLQRIAAKHLHEFGPVVQGVSGHSASAGLTSRHGPGADLRYSLADLLAVARRRCLPTPSTIFLATRPACPGRSSRG